MPLLMGILGAVVGGAGVSAVVRLALTEKLRSVFAAREHTFTREEVQRELETRGEKMTEDFQDRAEKMTQDFKTAAAAVRQEVENIVGPAVGRIERANEHTRGDIARMAETLERLAKQQREDSKLAAEAARLATAADVRSKGLETLVETRQALFVQFAARLDHIDRTMSTLSQDVAELKRSA